MKISAKPPFDSPYPLEISDSPRSPDSIEARKSRNSALEGSTQRERQEAYKSFARNAQKSHRRVLPLLSILRNLFLVCAALTDIIYGLSMRGCMWKSTVWNDLPFLFSAVAYFAFLGAMYLQTDPNSGVSPHPSRKVAQYMIPIVFLVFAPMILVREGGNFLGYSVHVVDNVWFGLFAICVAAMNTAFVISLRKIRDIVSPLRLRSVNMMVQATKALSGVFVGNHYISVTL